MYSYVASERKDVDYMFYGSIIVWAMHTRRLTPEEHFAYFQLENLFFFKGKECAGRWGCYLLYSANQTELPIQSPQWGVFIIIIKLKTNTADCRPYKWCVLLIYSLWGPFRVGHLGGIAQFKILS